MARLPIGIRAMLLKSGKEQFLAHGFEKASLRTICKKAGLTTGAFYNHFSGKEDLFAALVEPMLRGFQNMYREVISQELSDLSTGTDNELTSITYAVAHKDEFRLLFECSGGTKYEGFREHLIHEVFYHLIARRPLPQFTSSTADRSESRFLRVNREGMNCLRMYLPYL